VQESGCNLVESQAGLRRLAEAESVEHGQGTPTFEEIYEAYAERVLNLAYRMTGDAEAARDLTQDVFVKVYENLDSFERRSHVFTWIYRIAVNHVTNHLKKEKRRRWVSFMDSKVSDVFREGDTGAPGDAPANEVPADKKLEADERAKLVWSAVQALPVQVPPASRSLPLRRDELQGDRRHARDQLERGRDADPPGQETARARSRAVAGADMTVGEAKRRGERPKKPCKKRGFAGQKG
jgi:RNA polymerase sigma factor (sigma-70 family)